MSITAFHGRTDTKKKKRRKEREGPAAQFVALNCRRPAVRCHPEGGRSCLPDSVASLASTDRGAPHRMSPEPWRAVGVADSFQQCSWAHRHLQIGIVHTTPAEVHHQGYHYYPFSLIVETRLMP